jgi:hypothetical protein
VTCKPTYGECSIELMVLITNVGSIVINRALHTRTARSPGVVASLHRSYIDGDTRAYLI